MKRYLTYAIAALIVSGVVAFASPEKDALMARENAAWQAFKDKKADDFKKVVSAAMIGVYAQGISDVAKEMSDMQKWDMKSVAISDYNVVAVGTDTMMSTYKVTLAGTFGGQDAGGVYNAGSVWKMENGAWMAIFHTNAKVAMAADAQKKE